MIRLTKKFNLNEIDSNCIIVFSAIDCKMCTKLIENLKQVNPNCSIYILDDISGRQLGAKFNIMSAPTTVKLINYEEVDRMYGASNVDAIKNFCLF